MLYRLEFYMYMYIRVLPRAFIPMAFIPRDDPVHVLKCQYQLLHTLSTKTMGCLLPGLCLLEQHTRTCIPRRTWMIDGL